MDEQAVSNLHGWAQSKGYPGSVEEFSVLLQSDDGAFQSAYSYAQEQGFPGDISAFKNLVGRKKKDATESVSDDGLLESLQPEVAVSESVSVQAPPEPIEQLDETPTRVFGEEVAEEQVEAMPVGQSTAVKMPGAPEPALDLSTGDVEFDKSMEFVDASLVDRGDERQVARELSAEFKDFGFDFESTGIGDAIKVTARNGETMDVDLDPAWYNFGVDEGEEAKSLRKFLTENKDTSELVDAEEAFKEAEAMYGEYKAQENELVAEFEANAATIKALPKDDVEGYNKLIEQQDMLLARGQKLVRESADSEDLYRESYANLERLSKPKEKLTALERVFGRGSLTNWTSDLSVRAKDQGLAQGATIRPNLNLAINGNNVTDEELEDFRRALASSAEAGPSDEMQELGRIVDKKSEGLSYGGKMLVALSETLKRPQLLPELVVSSVAMMANKEVAEGALAGGGLGAGGALLYGQLGPQVALPEELFTVPASFLTGAAGGAATTLETGLSFAEFMMEELAEKQGVDINQVDMSNESLREVLSDSEAMSRLRNRSAGRGVAMGLFNMVTKNFASGVTRRVVGRTGSKLKGILAAGAVDAPLEGAGEAIGRVAGRQEMTPLELVLETAAVGPGFAIGVAEGLIRAPKYTLNGEAVGGVELARFIREADEADVAGATIEIKNDKVLAGLASDKRNTARERQIIGKQLRESGVTDDAKVQTLTDLELEKRKLKGNETTSGKKKAERIQREIDATLDGDSYFFEEETDEKGNTISKEVRVTRREAVDALKDDDIINPTEKEIEAKQAELFRDAMAEIGREDAIQESSTEEVDVGEQPADGEEVGVGDTEVVTEEEAVVDEEAEELAERLEAEGTPDVTEQVAENVTAERKEGTTLGKKQQRIVEQAKKRAVSLAKSVSGLNVKLYETTDQYQKATNKTGKGVYLKKVDEQGNVIDKTIHINLETANSRTVAHEAFHAMFLENLSESETQAQAKALMTTVRKAVAGDSALANRIDQFLAAYNEAEIDEEALSEIFGYISNGYGELTAPEQSKVKAVIKALIERVTGIKLESGWSEGDQNVLDLFNTLAEKMEAGEEITAEEVGGLKVSEERVAEVEADTEIDTRIAAAQEKLAGASEAVGTVLGELSSLLDEVEDEAASKLLASVKKTISAKQVGATVKKIRDVKKSKRMSADDKAEALTKLEAKLDGQLEVLEKARDGVQEKVDSAVERVKAKAEAQRAEVNKTERLAQIKDEGKAITKERAKAISKAKKEFEGEELKTALEVIEEETKAKRDKLKTEKAELEKKKPAVETEPAVEEAEPAVEEKPTVETEQEVTPEEETKTEAEPAVEEQPTVATIRTKVGVEAFGKLEAAVRSYLDYISTVNPFEEERTRGEKATISRRDNKVNKLADELGLTGTELAVVLNSVREARIEEKRAEENRKAEEAELKDAAERAKKAAEEQAEERKQVDKETVNEKQSLKTISESKDNREILDAIAALGNQYSARKVFVAFAKNPQLTPFQKRLANILAKRVPSTVTIAVSDVSAGADAQLSSLYKDGKVTGSAIEISSTIPLKKLTESLLHEGIHAVVEPERTLVSGATAGELNRLGRLVLKHLKENRKELEEKYPNVYRGYDDFFLIGNSLVRYATKPAEIITYALTNADIQKIMKGVPDPDGGTTWSSFVESVRKILGLNTSDRTALDSVLEVFERVTPYESGETVPSSDIQAAEDNRKEMFQQDVADIEAMEVGDSIEAGDDVITKVGEDRFEFSVREDSRSSGGFDIALRHLNEKRAEARAGKKVSLRGYKVSDVRANKLKRGDVVTTMELGKRVVFRVTGIAKTRGGEVVVELEVIDIGNSPVGIARQYPTSADFEAYSIDYLVGQITRKYFKKKTVKAETLFRPKIQRIDNWDAVNRKEQPAVEEAPAVEQKPTVSEAEKRAALEDITVEEAERQTKAESLEAEGRAKKDEVRKTDAELAKLKGKTDTKSKARRNALKEYRADLGTMSIAEAKAKRDETPAVVSEKVQLLEEDLRKAQEELDFYNRDEPDNTKYPKYKSFKQAKEAINAGKDPRFLGVEDNPTFPAQGANENLDGKFMAEQRTPFITGMETTMVMEDSARTALESINRTYRATKSRDTTGVGEDLESRVESLKKELAKETQAPKAREQRVADVVERYDFRPNGSLRESSLAAELRRNLKRYGFGVKQFGTRMDDIHIVNPATGRKVDPKKLIEKDRAEEAIEREEIEAIEQEVAEERALKSEAEDLRSEELKQYTGEYLDFPEDMIPPSRLSSREQREALSDAAKGLSTAAVVRFAKERGYSNKVILALRPNAKQAIDKYEEQLGRVNKEIQAIIQRTRERARGDKNIQAIDNKGARTRAVNDRIEKDVLAYLQGTKFYKNASDVGREAMVRSVRKQMGRRIKAAPSVIKLGIKDGIPTIDKADLNYQLRKMAESSRLTAVAMRQAMREIGKDIAKLESAGMLTKKQALQIIKKLSKTDPLNPVQVENFVNFAARVFSDADYTAEVARMNKLRKRAFSNAEKKLGIPKDFMPMLRTLLAMDAGMIPDVAFEDYVKLVEMLGERKAELDLEDVNMVGDVVSQVMNAVDEELSLKEELLARYVNYPNKKKGYKSTIKAMVDDGELSAESELDADGNKMPSEADILLKYINELDESEEAKTEEQKELDRDKEKVMLLTAIEALPSLGRVLPTREERALAKRFDRLIRTEAVNKLSNAELKNVLRVASNIENGFLSHNAQVLVEKMEAEQRAREVEQAIREADIPKTKLAYAKAAGRFGGPNSTLELIKRNPLRYIDQVLGNFKSNRVYDAVFKPLAKAYSQYNAEMIAIQERLDAVQAKLVAKHKRNPNAVTRSKFLIGAYMMQREYESNIGVDGVFSAEELLQATIDGSGVGNAYYTGATTQMLQDILDKDVRGKTADEIEAALSPEEKSVAKEIRAINDELTPKAQYVAGVLRGVPFRPFSQYFHRIVLSDKQRAGMSGMQGLIEQVNTNMRPSTRAKNLEIRTGSIAPVNFDPFASANRGAKFILTDYYMTDPVRTAGRMANDLNKVKFDNEQERSLKDAIAGSDGAINTAITDVLMQSYTINTAVDKALEFVKRQSYRMALADGPRFIAELLSNLAFVGFANPGGFVEGVRVMRDVKGMKDYSGVDVLRNVNSVQTTRLFPKPDTISSRMVDSLRTSLGPDQSRVTGEVMNNLKQIYAQTGKRLQDSKLTSQLADWMITTPDKMVTQPVWFGVFSQKFKEQTGEDVDFTKLAENDESYMNRYEQAIKDATDAADDASVRTGATDNVFLGILRGTVRPDDSLSKKWFAVANSYMTRFLIFEYATARTAIQAAIGNGTISRGEGRRLIMATTARMVLYSFIVDILRRELDKSLGLGDDDDDDIGGSLGNAFASAVASMVIGRTSGQVGRGLKGIAVEYLNEDFLYPGDYDPYGDAILDPLIRMGGDKRAMPNKELFDASIGLSGPYGAPLRTGGLGYKLVREGEKKTGSAQDRREAEFNRLYLELAGMFGYVPIYKDLRRLYIKEIYKDLD